MKLLLSIMAFAACTSMTVAECGQNGCAENIQVRISFNESVFAEVVSEGGSQRLPTGMERDSLVSAIRRLYDCLDENPIDPLFNSMIARWHWKLGEIEKADQYYARITNPDSVDLQKIPEDVFFVQGLFFIETDQLARMQDCLSFLEIHDSSIQSFYGFLQKNES